MSTANGKATRGRPAKPQAIHRKLVGSRLNPETLAALEAFIDDRKIATRSNAIEMLLACHPDLQAYRHISGKVAA